MPVPTNSYNDLIPQATDLLSNSQLSLLNNFGAIKTLIDVDHVDFSNAAGGQHNKVSLVVQSPAPTFAAGQVGLYSFLSPVTAKNELYVNKTNNSGIVQIPSTASVLGTSNPTPGASGNATGWTMLPSGIKLVWGNFLGSGAVQTITIAGAQQFGTTILSVQLTVIDPATGFGQALARVVNFPTANSFRAVVSNPGATGFSATNVMYLAIGY